MGVKPDEVAAIVVTRGDVDLTEILEPLAVLGEILVWDNSRREDMSVYGRYAAIVDATRPVVLVQDDDCVLEPDAITALLDGYEPGVLVANMPDRFRAHYPDSCLVGFGAIFDRHLPEAAFQRWGWRALDAFLRADVTGELFYRECDAVFTTLTPRKLLDLPYRDLPHAHAADRLWKQPGHGAARARMLELARQVRDAA